MTWPPRRSWSARCRRRRRTGRPGGSPPMIASTMRVAVAVGDARHGVLHHVGALLVDALELEGVQRRLVVVAGPDVVDAALALDQQLVDIGRRPADMGVGRPDIAFLVAAHAHAAAARPADIAGRQRDVHQRAVGAVVVVAPDQALLVGEHGPPALAVLGLGDPARPPSGSARRVRPVIFAASSSVVLLAASASSKPVVDARDELLVDPALARRCRSAAR